jgi:hypothetical protein
MPVTQYWFVTIPPDHDPSDTTSPPFSVGSFGRVIIVSDGGPGAPRVARASETFGCQRLWSTLAA